MEAWFLRQWQVSSPWQAILRPLSWLFALMTMLRRALYRSGIWPSTRVGVPVIVVGNITVGGTGKTPLVLALVQSLARAGWRCGIVSRGYSRKAPGIQTRTAEELPIRVVSATLPPNEVPTVGDEAAMLAARSGVPVYVSADRAAAAAKLLRDHPDVNVLISDDGLQHYALQRDIEICVVDGERGFGNGALLPAGPLRESIGRLRVVDAIVVHGALDHSATADGIDSQNVATFSMVLGNESIVRIRDAEPIALAAAANNFSGKKILAIAGTGHPARFFAHLTRLGFSLAETRSFPDHHAFSAGDFAVQDVDIILMTEKDAVKCKAFADERMWFMRVDAILPGVFDEFVAKRMSTLRK